MILVAFLIVTFIVVNVLFWVSYFIHISMVKMETPEKYANGTFPQFMGEFAKRSWDRKPKWRYSYFGIGDEWYINYIHADIIKFDNVGMIFNPLSYLQFKVWAWKSALPKINHSREYKDYWNKEKV
jgi:hypothetical protein